MPDLIKGNRDTLPDHMSSSGDTVAACFIIDAIGENDQVLHALKVTLYASRALSVEGHCGNEEFETTLFDHAIDELRGFHVSARPQLSIPGKDVSLPGLKVKTVNVYGTHIDVAPFAVAVIEDAKKTLSNSYARQKAQNGASVLIL